MGKREPKIGGILGWLAAGGSDPTDPVAISSISRRLARGYKADLMKDPCAYCGESAVVLDHIDPKSRGGGDAWWNLTAACWSCNTSKGSRSLVGFLGTRVTRIRERLAVVRAEAAIWARL